MSNVIEMNKVIISKAFKSTYPKSHKLENVRNYFEHYGELDKPIVINNSNVLVDGYVRYLIALEYGLDVIPFVYVQEYKEYNNNILDNPVPFITGVFEDGNKEYVWKNDKNIPIEIGDKVEVRSWNCQKKRVDKMIVIVTNTFESDLSSMLRHKSVISKVA